MFKVISMFDSNYFPAEKLLKNRNQKLCRETAIKNYSIKKSYERILECLK